MDAAVILEDEPARILHELCLHGSQEVVVLEQLLTLLQLLLGARKVCLDEEVLQEFCRAASELTHHVSVTICSHTVLRRNFEVIATLQRREQP